MNAVATDERPKPRLFEPGGRSLEDSILEIWRELVGSQPARCPVCDGRLTITAGCEDCGSELS